MALINMKKLAKESRWMTKYRLKMELILISDRLQGIDNALCVVFLWELFKYVLSFRCVSFEILNFRLFFETNGSCYVWRFSESSFADEGKKHARNFFIHIKNDFWEDLIDFWSIVFWNFYVFHFIFMVVLFYQTL